MKSQSIRYSGSKQKVLPQIGTILEGVPYTKVLDGFSGSTRVSQFFKNCKKTVSSNDLAVYSKVLAECYLKAFRPKSYYQEIVDHLNSLTTEEGWYTETYGGLDNAGSSVQSDGCKRPFQMHVTKKLDPIREEINKLFSEECIDRSVLLASLLLALDSVCNDMGHHTSYLRNWSKKSYKDLILKVPDYEVDDLEHMVYCDDVFNLADKKHDLCYFDPPYGTANKKTKTTRVRYFSYYHLWTTVCKNDRPTVIGAAKRREDVSSDSLPNAISVFENLSDSVVESSFVKLLTEFDSKNTLISYNNRSKIQIDKLIDICTSYQKLVKVLNFSHKESSQARTTINGKWKQNYGNENREYLILLEK